MPWLARRAGRRRPESEKQKSEKQKGSKRNRFEPFCCGNAGGRPPPSGSGFQLGIKIGDHILEGRNGLLNRCNLNQLPARHRAFAILQRDDQIPPLLLELDERQAVIRQMSHHDIPTP
jgi:hypothetical protein